MHLTCGAMGIRTPDLLHAICRQHVHSSTYAQASVSGRAYQSPRIHAGGGTFLLYSPGCPGRSPRTLRYLRPPAFASPATPVLAHASILVFCMPR
jgi:hypothetical protein